MEDFWQTNLHRFSVRSARRHDARPMPGIPRPLSHLNPATLVEAKMAIHYPMTPASVKGRPSFIPGLISGFAVRSEAGPIFAISRPLSPANPSPAKTPGEIRYPAGPALGRQPRFNYGSPAGIEVR